MPKSRSGKLWPKYGYEKGTLNEEIRCFYCRPKFGGIKRDFLKGALLG
jgi:hypothetical protein